jgi:host factor-I protein
MANEKSPNIQDVFLNTLRKKKIPVTIFLSNGVKLQGNITSFDNFSVLLRRGPQVQLVYKHTIATVVPSTSVVLSDEEGVEEAHAHTSA